MNDLVRTSVRRRFRFPLAAALALALAACRADPGAPPLEGATMGGPFTLTAQDGRRVSDTDFRGRYRIVYFGYAFCPDACPTTLLAIGNALKDLGPDADKVQPIFITVDPARDTVKELKLYSSNFSPRILMLTGPPADTAAVAKEYRVFYEKVPQPGGGKDDYLVNHTSLVYLMSRNGRFLTDFAPGFTPQQMANGIKRFF